MSASRLDAVHAMNERIADLDDEIARATAEVEMLQHIDDDAQRDALVTDNAEDRQVARMTRRDVRRGETTLDHLRRNRDRLVRKRAKAIDRIARA